MVKIVWCFLIFAAAVAAAVHGGNVTYDSRSLIIDGQRRMLFSGSIHYPRSTPQMWPSLITKAKEGGLDVIDTYVFWNFHEPQRGQYDFEGRKDIIKFIKEIQAQGLYACLRIGPFIESEWNYGGLPFWLHDIPGIVYRSDNEPFKAEMQKFVTKIVNMMKSERLFASQGGPIIISQIENEYQMVEPAFHEKGPPYVKWAAKMAVGLQTGVPWVMCKQDDAPDPVINACNGLRCGETFVGPNSPQKPSIWTENWTQRYQVYGEQASMRSPTDVAFHVALFIAKNGSFVNYYMYHGGTNFGRSSSAFVPTSYYDLAPLDEYGLIRQPSWGHLKNLHAAVKLCSKPLLLGTQSTVSLGQKQQAYVFLGKSGECAAFLVNNGSDATVRFQDHSYELPQKSISILPDCKKVAYNTAKVSTQYTTRSMVPGKKFHENKMWVEFQEAIPNFEETPIKSDKLLEHMSTTKDASDYLWYTFRFPAESSYEAILKVYTLGHVLHTFANGVLVGSAHGSHQNGTVILDSKVSLKNGTNNFSLLSAMVGLPDSGAYMERRVAGLRRVSLQNKNFRKDFSNYSWGYQVGLQGENLKIYTKQGSSLVQWRPFSNSRSRLTWYKTSFNAPPGNMPVALNLGSMGKGEVWVNSHSIGRYWVSFRTPEGSPSQTWYHVPRYFLEPTGNSLVILEEESGSPLEISLDTIISNTKLCGHVTDSHMQYYGKEPEVHLQCPPKTNISNITFASFGNPSGDCESYDFGSCHSPNSKAVVEKACLGKRSCSVPQTDLHFGGDPCPGISKSLLVDAQCS